MAEPIRVIERLIRILETVEREGQLTIEDIMDREGICRSQASLYFNYAAAMADCVRVRRIDGICRNRAKLIPIQTE